MYRNFPVQNLSGVEPVFVLSVQQPNRIYVWREEGRTTRQQVLEYIQEFPQGHPEVRQLEEHELLTGTCVLWRNGERFHRAIISAILEDEGVSFWLGDRGYHVNGYREDAFTVPHELTAIAFMAIPVGFRDTQPPEGGFTEQHREQAEDILHTNEWRLEILDDETHAEARWGNLWLQNGEIETDAVSALVTEGQCLRRGPPQAAFEWEDDGGEWIDPHFDDDSGYGNSFHTDTATTQILEENDTDDDMEIDELPED